MDSVFPTLSAASVVCMGISTVIALLLPLALAIGCLIKRRGSFICVMIGAFCFFIGAGVLESILHNIVFTLLPSIRQMPALYVLYGCLAAGLFEETARLLGLRYLCTRCDGLSTGLAYGVGHGGMEAIMIGFSMLSSLLTMGLVAGGQAESLLVGLSADELSAATAQVSALAAQPPFYFLMGGVERLSALAIHLALSVLIWMVVTHRLPMWGYALSIALHAGVNVWAALTQIGVIANIYLCEALIALSTAALVALVVWLYKNHRQAPQAQQA